MARTRTISLRMEGTTKRFRSSSLSCVMHCMIEGGHESGILNSIDRAEADDNERVSSVSPDY